METLYLDNAATSFPKPEAMLAAMINYSQAIGASPGRSGHGLSIDAGRIVFEAREKLARLFNIEDPLRIAFTKNVTEAVNIVLFGLLKRGDHVVTTSMEHNSVMRPLRFLQSQGVELSVIPCSSQGDLDPNDVHRALRTGLAAQRQALGQVVEDVDGTDGARQALLVGDVQLAR